MLNIKKLKSVVLLALLFSLTLSLFSFMSRDAFADSEFSAGDGKYSVTIGTDLAMSKESVSDKGFVEKQGDKYYLSVYFDSSLLDDISLSISGKSVGTMSQFSGNYVVKTFSLSYDNLISPLSVSVYVVPMRKTKNVVITAKMDSLTRISDIDDRGERPAEFVPVIDTTCGKNYVFKKGSIFNIPSATAYLGTDELPVDISCYYIASSANENVEILSNQITFAKLGEYHLIYKSSSPLFKTSLDNDSFSIFDAKIIVKSDAVTIAKFKDENKVLPENSVVQASQLTEGVAFDNIKSSLITVSDNYNIINVGYYDEKGHIVTPSDNVSLLLQPASKFARDKVVVYHVSDDGTLTRLDCTPYGRYVKVDTDKTGNFVVCIPGVAFVMPMWGYMVITIVGALILISAIVIPIVVVKKRKKNKIIKAVDEIDVTSI